MVIGEIGVFDKAYAYQCQFDKMRHSLDAVSILNRAALLADMFRFYHENKDYFSNITLINNYFKKMNYAVGRMTPDERIETFDATVFFEMATDAYHRVDDVVDAWMLMMDEGFNLKLWKRGL